MSADPEDTVTMHVVPEPVTEAATEKRPSPAVAYATFGDMLIATMPGYDIWPCGRCGRAFAGYDTDLLAEDRMLAAMVAAAREAGWAADPYGIWSCCACLDALEDAPAMEEDGTEEALHLHQRTLHEYDLKARATMTGGGRHEWGYETWRDTWRPRPARCEPDPAWPAAETSAA